MHLQPLLTEYLLENGSLPLINSGQIFIDRKSAVMRENDSLLESPRFSVVFLKEEPSTKEVEYLSAFISQRLSISQQEAIQLLIDEANLQTASTVYEQNSWPPFGHLAVEEGAITFQQETIFPAYLADIPLQRHEHHPVIMPVEQLDEAIPISKSVYEIPELQTRKNNWWIWVIIIFIISALLISFHYFG